jgi:NDP-sugar pyrophosphorylase family protein
MKAVIQCGGQGTRLRPYTMVLPKPLMPVKAQPVLELLLKWLRRNDIQDVYITTGYLGHLIRSVFGNGSQYDMRIKYTEEREPLGTIGPLTMLRDDLNETFLVINGDVLTDLNLSSFASSHASSGALVSVASAIRKTKLDFGVIEQTNGRITSFREKPMFSNLMSMGVYCMQPAVLDHIPTGVAFGFDDLILRMLARDLPAHTFIHEGLWLDIGRVEDFQNAQQLAWDSQPPAFQIVEAA